MSAPRPQRRARPAAKTLDLRTNDSFDLHGLLDRLGTAIATVRVVHRSLRHLEIAGAEETTLGVALIAFDQLHVDLDAAERAGVRRTTRERS